MESQKTAEQMEDEQIVVEVVSRAVKKGIIEAYTDLGIMSQLAYIEQSLENIRRRTDA